MPLDPRIKALLDMAAGLPDAHTLRVAEARATAERRVDRAGPAMADACDRLRRAFEHAA